MKTTARLGLAALMQRAGFAMAYGGVALQWWRQTLTGQHGAHCIGGGHHLRAQFRCDRHDPAALGTGVVQRALKHRVSGHELKAESLGGQLQVIARCNVRCLVAQAVFVLHRVRRAAVAVKFHHVRFTDQTQLVMPERQGTLDPQTRCQLHTRLIRPRVNGVAAKRVNVVVKRLLQVDQCTLARAVGPVLQSAERDGRASGSGSFMACVA